MPTKKYPTKQGEIKSKAKPTAGSDKPKIKKTSKSHDDYEENQLRLYTNMYGK